MAIQGLGNVWTSSGNTDSIEYQNGASVDYTYASTGRDSSVEGYSNIQQGGQASIDFDVPASGIVLNLGGVDFNPGDWADYVWLSVDGSVIDVGQWIDDGKISVTGGGATGNGENLAHPEGSLVPAVSGVHDLVVTFHVPISTLSTNLYPSTNAPEWTGVDVGFHVEDTAAQAESSAPCFTAGTLIDTDQGAVAVETLQAGDRVRTKDHGFQPVKWVGASRVYATGFDVPLRIKKGTFGNSRDLVVSKRHKMLMDHTHLSLMFDVEEAFACAMHLRNDDTIVREPEGWVTYYHVLLPQHEVIYAEGAATESFYPDEGTLAGIAKGTKEELLEHFDPTTYGPQARLTFDPMRAMWIGRNLDILNGNDMGQIAAYENVMKVAE